MLWMLMRRVRDFVAERVTLAGTLEGHEQDTCRTVVFITCLRMKL